jgi:predicted metalloprotease with PDZ domain
MKSRLVLLVVAILLPAAAFAQAPIEYRLTFPAPEQRWMQVDARFPDAPPGPVELRMARTSPGRYALTEFAKNVFDVSVTDGAGRALAPARPNLHQWTVTGHDGTVVVRYKIFGDRTDGTYLGIDSMHAHINIPAALMFARGWFTRPARVTFVRPAGKTWNVATQLYPTADPLVFTAPNVHYLMDSPTEFSDFTLRTFPVDDGKNGAQTFRVALLHDGTPAEADAFAKDVERVVRAAIEVFGELPAFDAGTYTFISVYLPWVNGDGMEHRNSTSLTSQGSLRSPAQRQGLIGTVSHEFVHAWNMERIRSKALEPFDFEEADVSEELWLGEGFTSYYGDLILHRAGLEALDGLLTDFAGMINQVAIAPGRRFRSAVEMSRLAPFVDAAVSVDRTAWPNLFISYYTYGSAIALALDLSLRDRSDGRVTLDDYMRALWQSFGKPGQKVPGLVATPYTMDDLKATLAKVSGDAAFAREFFARYIEGRDLADYDRLLARAGLVARKRAAGRAWLGQVSLQAGGGVLRVGALVPWESPLYRAGVAFEDQIVNLDGTDLTSQQALEAVLMRHKPGDTVPIRFVRRSGEAVNAALTFDEDPRIEIVPVERTGGTLTPAQQAFRDAWLGR